MCANRISTERTASALHRRICALASPEMTLSQIATACGCDPTYVGTVLGRHGLAFRRQGISDDRARHVGLLPTATPLTDRRETESRERDGHACQELLLRLRRIHPRVA